MIFGCYHLSDMHFKTGFATLLIAFALVDAAPFAQWYIPYYTYPMTYPMYQQLNPSNPPTYHRECYDKLIQSQQEEENHPECPVCYNKVKPGTGVTDANETGATHYDVSGTGATHYDPYDTGVTYYGLYGTGATNYGAYTVDPQGNIRYLV